MKTREQTLNEGETRLAGPTRGSRTLLKLADASRYAVAAACHGWAYYDLARGAQTVFAPTLLAAVLTASVSLLCRLVGGRATHPHARHYRWLSRNSLSMCAAHIGTLLLTAVFMNNSPETPRTLAVGFLIFALYSAFMAAGSLLSSAGRTAAAAGAEDEPAAPCFAPLHKFFDMPEGICVFVPPSTLVRTARGTLMLDGTVTASNAVTTEHTLRVIRAEHGFCVAEAAADLVAGARKLGDRELPEHVFVVINQ